VTGNEVCFGGSRRSLECRKRRRVGTDETISISTRTRSRFFQPFMNRSLHFAIPLRLFDQSQPAFNGEARKVLLIGFLGRKTGNVLLGVASLLAVVCVFVLFDSFEAPQTIAIRLGRLWTFLVISRLVCQVLLSLTKHRRRVAARRHDCDRNSSGGPVGQLRKVVGCKLNGFRAETWTASRLVLPKPLHGLVRPTVQ
jgi:hypothetical protein